MSDTDDTKPSGEVSVIANVLNVEATEWKNAYDKLTADNEQWRLETKLMHDDWLKLEQQRDSLRAENIKLKEQLSLHSVFAALPFQEENEKLRASLKDVQHEMHLQSITIHSTREELERKNSEKSWFEEMRAQMEMATGFRQQLTATREDLKLACEGIDAKNEALVAEREKVARLVDALRYCKGKLEQIIPQHDKDGAWKAAREALADGKEE
jgi:methionine aminopeptidase